MMVRMTRNRCLVALLAACMVIGASAPALADITAFLGVSGGPTNRLTKGFAFGLTFVIAGVEFEYASTDGDTQAGASSGSDLSPHIQTFMVNALLQTPVPIARMQFYGTLGAGVYREDLGVLTATNLGTNFGGGVKINLVGPLRVRAEYRMFRLSGTPIGNSVVNRFYVGANLKF
jgi:opacity protein-like surface antigen